MHYPGYEALQADLVCLELPLNLPINIYFGG